MKENRYLNFKLISSSRYYLKKKKYSIKNTELDQTWIIFTKKLALLNWAKQTAGILIDVNREILLRTTYESYKYEVYDDPILQNLQWVTKPIQKHTQYLRLTKCDWW